MTDELCIREATPADRDLLTALLTGLSTDSAYLRFQTGLGPVPRPAVLDALLPARPGARALLGIVADRLVAHGLWVRAGRAAEIGIVVADAHQGGGIGTALATALVEDLAAHGVDRVEVFAGAGNEAVRRMVARRAPHAVRVLDGPTVTWTFPVEPRPVAGALAG